jgi:CheY-like chemotaxis protein
LARKILLADDSVTAQNMGRKILADAGYEVIAVNNGSAALKKIAELKPDLVILDVYMPGYSGLEVCQRLKETPDTARIPVLLTVGKLEPFKPEEAQRVRAEGFIVKPFEASELLSTLSKLEDKVVPRSEPSKPGRFARAMAAVEDGRITKNDASNEDEGWKSRIGFPKKKAEPEEPAAEEQPIYNAMNRDLRTVVETPANNAAEKVAASAPEKATEKQEPQPGVAAESTVDVTAFAPPGFPKDVTPEEAAAIASAAAQIQMLTAAAKEESAAVPVSTEAAAQQQDASPAVQAEATAEVAGDNKVLSAVTESTVAETSVETKDLPAEETADQPVTMAVAVESGAVVAGETASRWQAVAIAVEGEEATLSLEHEMQKAYATFVAQETSSAPAESLPPPGAVTQEISPAPLEASVKAFENVTPSIENLPQAEAASVAASEPVAGAQSDTAAVAAVDPASTAPANEPVAIPEVVASAAVAVSSAEAPSPSVSTDQDLPTAAELMNLVAETQVHSIEASPSESAEPAMAASSSSDASTPHVTGEEESEAIKSSAAAWASWRQVRGNGNTQPAPNEGSQPAEAAVAAVEAAMAVAAGAEQIAQEASLPSASNENPADVASIVDSVLADLRPRLLAEITRKMSEKK